MMQAKKKKHDSVWIPGLSLRVQGKTFSLLGQMGVGITSTQFVKDKDRNMWYDASKSQRDH
jgi:hypothetical protein